MANIVKLGGGGGARLAVTYNDDDTQHLFIADSRETVLDLATLTDDADAIEEDVLEGKVFYAKGVRRVGTGAGGSAFPEFTYTGKYGLLDDGDGNWRIKLLSSGVFTPVDDVSVDIFLVGGGGGGACTSKQYYGGGGAGGYTATHRNVQLSGGTAYTVTIGAGGAPRVDGGTAENGRTGGSTSFDTLTVAGGTGGYCYPYSPSTGTIGASSPNGGSGGGGYQGVGGSDGGNGGGTNGGTGQGTTTREFGESNGDLYAGGGGCGSGSSSSSVGYAGGAGGGGMGASYGTRAAAMPGEANTGGGGGGGAYVAYVGGYGGCGVVVLRNKR